MKKYNAGEKVGYGLYISPKAFDAAFVGSDDETLSGKRGKAYYRIPTLLMFVAAPLLGGLFVLAFPVMVLAMVAFAIVKLVSQTVTSAVKSQAHLIEMNWQPSAAYLQKNKREKKGDAKQASELRDLDKEVENRRKNES